VGVPARRTRDRHRCWCNVPATTPEASIPFYFVGIAAFFVIWIAFWAVTFTGHYPRGMFDFATGYMRWSVRTTAYLYGLTDKYPPFRLRQ